MAFRHRLTGLTIVAPAGPAEDHPTGGSSMSTLVPSKGYISPRRARVASRELCDLEVRKEVEIAEIEVQAQIEAAKTHAVGYVGAQAMQAVTMVSQLELQLGQACPLAVTRLQGIADMTALSISQVVMDSARKIGR